MHSTIPHGQTDDAKIRAISAYSLTYEIRPAVTKSTKSMLVKPMTTFCNQRVSSYNITTSNKMSGQFQLGIGEFTVFPRIEAGP